MAGHSSLIRCGRRNGGPQWWLLYLIAAVLLGVVWLVEVTYDSGAVRKPLEAAAIVVSFCLVRAWVRGNRVPRDLQPRR